MKASELRIGNIVDYHRKVFAKGWNWINISHEDIYSIACGNDKNYRPIPLTEEWLLKFGFEKATFGSSPMFFSKNDSFGYIQEQAYGCNDNYGYCLNDEKMWFLEIKYVHSLQNLYFALTGEELTLQQ